MSWVAVAIGATAVGGGIYSAVSGNQRRQRNKGYIEQNYQLAKKNLQQRQSNVRQGTVEELAARGLAQGGLSPIARAMAGNAQHRDYDPTKKGIAGAINHAEVDAWNQSHEHDITPSVTPGTPHTLGDQQQADNDEQFRLEQTDLETKRDQAERENKADYIDTLVNAGLGTAKGVIGAIGAHGDITGMAAMGGAGGAAANPASDGSGLLADAPTVAAGGSGIRSAMMSGIDNPGNWWGGINGIDPLNAPGSSWERRTVSGDALRNDQFHK